MTNNLGKIFIIIWTTAVVLISASPLLIDSAPKILSSLTWLHGLLLVLTILIFYLVITYNKFVLYLNTLKQSLGGIDVQLKRRSDLIPNLVAVVQGYAKHESVLLTSIARLRAQLIGAQSTIQKSAINAQLTASLNSVFAVAEQYPKLQANEQFLQLQKELTATENEIAAARRIYNENVALYNTLRESFPSLFVGFLFGFNKSQYAQIS